MSTRLRFLCLLLNFCVRFREICRCFFGRAVLVLALWIGAGVPVSGVDGDFSEPLAELTGQASGLARIMPELAVDGRTMALANHSGTVAVYVLEEAEPIWKREAIHNLNGIYPKVSLALAGDLLVIGREEAGRTFGGSTAGAVSIHKRNEGGANQWGEVQLLEDWKNRYPYYFGSAVATDGKTIAVRHLTEVVLFRERMDSHGGIRWMEEARISNASNASDRSIDVSGNHLAILRSNNCYLYLRDVSEGSPRWRSVRTLSAPYATAVAIHGDTVVFNGEVNRAAAVSVARFNSQNNSWGAAETLVVPGGGSDSSFGVSLDVYGNTLAVGADGADGGNGRVYLFRRVGEGAAFAHVETVASGRSDGERLGQRVGLAEGFLVALGPLAADGTGWSGIAYGRRVQPDRPVILMQPESVSVKAGEPFVLRTEASGPAPVDFRWYRNSLLIAETDVPFFERAEASAGDEGSYFVEAVAETGVARSGNFSVSVQQEPPSVTVTPGPVYIAAGGLLELAPEVTGGFLAAYQWHKDGARLEGEQGRVLTIAAAAEEDSGTYRLRIANRTGDAWSEEIPVFVAESAPTILRQTSAQNVKEGEPVLLFVEVHGSEPLSFAWSRNGQAVPNGGSARLLLDDPRVGIDDGVYRVTVSNAFGETISREMPLTVRRPVPLPIRAGQRAQVSGSGISYDLYLPTTYDPQGKALPILVTFSPSGGGMVGHFQGVAGGRQMIIVGAIAPRNGTGWEDYSGYMHSLANDLRERVNFDPNLFFLAGFSGGGWAAFDYSKSNHPHVAGVFSMEGWMGDQYSAQDRYQENLLVARSYAALAEHYSRSGDARYLLPLNGIIRDWVHTGGHVSAPPPTQSRALAWLLSERARSPMDTREEAKLQEAEWRAQVSAGRADEVITECLDVFLRRPRTWIANSARVVMDEAFATTEADLRVREQPRQGDDLAADYLFFYAYGAEQSGSRRNAWNALQVRKGLLESSQDRTEEVLALFAKLPPYAAPARPYSVWRDDRLRNFPVDSREPGSDANGDGVANLMEYAFGFNPGVNNAAVANPAVNFGGESGEAAVRFWQSEFAWGIRQSLEVSPDLRNWFPVDLQTRFLGERRGEANRFEAALPVPAEGKLFVRQRVELPVEN